MINISSYKERLFLLISDLCLLMLLLNSDDHVMFAFHFLSALENERGVVFLDDKYILIRAITCKQCESGGECTKNSDETLK